MKNLFYIFLLLFVQNSFAQNAMTINGRAQGTSYSIKYFDEKQHKYASEIDSMLMKINKIFSAYDSTSTISKVNKNKPTTLDSLFKQCFETATHISKETNGAFDITVAPLVEAWGFGLKRKTTMNQQQVDSILQIVGYEKVFMYNNKIIKKDSRSTLDFNGIAQGYTADIISDFFLSKGIKNFIIEIGGEVKAHGSKPTDEPWMVGIEKPTENTSGSENGLKLLIKVNDLAVSTSGNYRKFYIENGVKYSHTIDPKSGYPAKNNVLSATIIAKDGAVADAYATACMVMGLEKTKVFLEKHPELLAYLLYSDDAGNIKQYMTNGFEKMIVDEAK